MSTSANIDFRAFGREVIGLERRRQVGQADTARSTGRRTRAQAAQTGPGSDDPETEVT